MVAALATPDGVTVGGASLSRETCASATFSTGATRSRPLFQDECMQVMTHDEDPRRTSLYRWAIALSCIFPAFVAGLVVSTMYVDGLLRRGWTARKAEWLFFFVDAFRSRLT